MRWLETLSVAKDETNKDQLLILYKTRWNLRKAEFYVMSFVFCHFSPVSPVPRPPLPGKEMGDVCVYFRVCPADVSTELCPACILQNEFAGEKSKV